MATCFVHLCFLRYEANRIPSLMLSAVNPRDYDSKQVLPFFRSLVDAAIVYNTSVVLIALCVDFIHAQGKSSALLSTLLLARSGLGATHRA